MLHDNTLDNIFMVQFYNIALLLLINIFIRLKLNIAATFCNFDCTGGGIDTHFKYIK